MTLHAPSPSDGRGLLRTVQAGIFLVLLTPFVVTDVFFPFVVGKAVYARAIIEITFVAWVALVLRHPRRRPAWSWTVAAFAVWLLASGLAAAFGVSPTRSLWSTYERMQGVFDLAHWFAFTVMAASVFRSAADWRLLFGVNLACSTVVCLIGLAQHYQIVHVDLIYFPMGLRMRSTLGNPSYVGAYAMVNALLGAALFVQSLGPAARRRPRLRWVRDAWAIMVQINLWGLWTTGSRGALTGLGAASLILIAYGTWKRMRAASWAAGVALAAAAALIVVARTTTILEPVVESNPTLQRLAGADREDFPIRSRVIGIDTGLRAFLDRPVLGWGPENFIVGWGRHIDVDLRDGPILATYDHAHNKPVEELATKGALGLLSYLALWGVMARVILRRLARLSGCDRIALCIVGAALAAYFVQNLFLFDSPATVMQFSLLVAFAAAVEAWRPASGAALRSPGAAFRLPPRWRPSLHRAAGLPASTAGAHALTAAAAVLMIAALAFVNVRTYAAAAALSDAMRTPRPWSDRLNDFTRSIGGFPGLANYPRLYLCVAASEAIGDMSDEEFRRTIDVVKAEAGRGLALEPQNWQFQAFLAAFHQLAAVRDPALLADARRHADRAAELAPGAQQVVEVLQEQERLERDAR